MCIFTTILIIISSKYRTFSSIYCCSFLKIIGPLKYIRSKGCIRSNRGQINNCCSLNIINTSINNLNTCYSTSIFSVKIDISTSNCTKSITLNSYFWCSCISTTCRNNCNRNNSTIIYNSLCNSTRTWIKTNCRIRCIWFTTTGYSNRFNWTSYRSSSSSTISTTTNNCNRWLRSISSSICIHKNTGDNTFSNNSSCCSTRSTSTNNGNKRWRSITTTTISNNNFCNRTINSYRTSSTCSTTTCNLNIWRVWSIIISTSICDINRGNWSKSFCNIWLIWPNRCSINPSTNSTRINIIFNRNSLRI